MMRTRALAFAAPAFTSGWIMLMRFAHHSGRVSDTTDFVLGVTFGVGAGLLAVAVWRGGRGCGI